VRRRIFRRLGFEKLDGVLVDRVDDVARRDGRAIDGGKLWQLYGVPLGLRCEELFYISIVIVTIL
jgi:hypothetical protein